jgi:hypothetical protein
VVAGDDGGGGEEEGDGGECLDAEAHGVNEMDDVRRKFPQRMYESWGDEVNLEAWVAAHRYAKGAEEVCARIFRLRMTSREGKTEPRGTYHAALWAKEHRFHARRIEVLQQVRNGERRAIHLGEKVLWALSQHQFISHWMEDKPAIMATRKGPLCCGSNALSAALIPVIAVAAVVDGRVGEE